MKYEVPFIDAESIVIDIDGYLYCKKQYDNPIEGIHFKVNKRYKVSKIDKKIWGVGLLVPTMYNPDYVSYEVFFSLVNYPNCRYVYDYFYTKKEIRKIKLKIINENT